MMVELNSKEVNDEKIVHVKQLKENDKKLTMYLDLPMKKTVCVPILSAQYFAGEK